MKKYQKGFTLYELMIVIALIAIIIMFVFFTGKIAFTVICLGFIVLCMFKAVYPALVLAIIAAIGYYWEFFPLV